MTPGHQAQQVSASLIWGKDTAVSTSEHMTTFKQLQQVAAQLGVQHGGCM